LQSEARDRRGRREGDGRNSKEMVALRLFFQALVSLMAIVVLNTRAIAGGEREGRGEERAKKRR